MNMFISMFEGLCSITLGAVLSACGFDPADFETEESED